MLRMFSAYAQVRALCIILSFVVTANAAAAESYKIDKKKGGKLCTTTAPIDVVAQPKAGAKQLASYQPGAIMAVIGEAKGTGYLYVSPCNACDNGFVAKAEFLSKAKH